MPVCLLRVICVVAMLVMILSFVIPNSGSARGGDDLKKLSSAQQSDDMSSAGRQPWSNFAGLV